MAIDWTKPIRQKNGKALRFLHELQSSKEKYPVNCVATSDDGNEYLVTYTKDGLYNRDNKRGSTYDVENISDIERAQPEIDWAGEVQYRCPSRDEWQDIQIIGGTIYGCVWVCHANGKPKTLLIEAFYFRNKPAEPKPVQAILKMFRSPKQGIVMKAYLKNDATTVASVRRWHKDTEGELLDVIEVDLHNIEGLEDEK